MQATVTTQAPPEDTNKIVTTTMIIVVVLSVGVATVSTGVAAALVGKLVGVPEAA